MDEQQAIINLKKLFSEHELDLPHTDSLETLHLAISALNKQIPKKPIPWKPWEGKCPVCSVVFANRLTSYCGSCGQKLDWSE